VKKCRICKTEYAPFNSLQKVCSPGCAIELVKADQAKAEGCRAKERRKDTRRRKEALKTRSDRIEEAKTPCHTYIRTRDRDDPCISCGRYDWEIKERYTGGKWDAGHYKSKGAFPELRFHPMNIHKQCKSCNGGSGKYAKKNHTVSQQYKENLIKKIGQDMVDWLDGPHGAQNWVIDDLIEIKQYYREQLKYLKGEI